MTIIKRAELYLLAWLLGPKRVAEIVARVRRRKLAAIRAAHADHDHFEQAAALIMPLLETNPTWKWRDAVAHLHRTGATLPPHNPYLDLDRMEAAP